MNRAIWALGLRNPFSFAVQPGSGRVFINDVGQSAFEEIDVGRAGANYGWPQTEGPNPTGRSGVTYPLYAYTRTGDPAFSGISITGGVFYNPPGLSFPARYVGSYFFVDLTGGWIDQLNPTTGAVSAFATGLTGQLIVAVDLTPGGDLIYLARNNGTGAGAVYRVSFAAAGASIAVGTAPGAAPLARLVNPADGTPRLSVTAFDANFRGGTRVATGDVTGDGTPDLIAGAGPGGGPQVTIFDGTNGQPVRSYFAFETTFTGGVFVASADFDRDGFADVVVSPDVGGGPRVQVFSGKDGSVLANFFGIDDPSFRGGARVAAGDLNGDGVPDLVASAGTGGGPRVAVFDGRTIRPGATPTRLFGDFFAFDPNLRNGVYVAVGDANGDGTGDLVVGAGPGGGPRVVAFSGLQPPTSPDSPTLASFFAGDPNSRAGVTVAARNVDADAAAEIVTGTAVGSASGSRVSLYELSGSGATPLRDFLAFDAAYTGGVFVG